MAPSLCWQNHSDWPILTQCLYCLGSFVSLMLWWSGDSLSAQLSEKNETSKLHSHVYSTFYTFNATHIHKYMHVCMCIHIKNLFKLQDSSYKSLFTPIHISCKHKNTSYDWIQENINILFKLHVFGTFKIGDQLACWLNELNTKLASRPANHLRLV